MKKIRYILILLFTSLTVINAHELDGKVQDSNTKLPIEGVGVFNETTGGYTYTDANGKYHLEDIEKGNTILFKGLGYTEKAFTITKEMLDSILDVLLDDDVVSLDQVVLTSEVNALKNYVNVDVKQSPIKSSQEILRTVPGLIIGQHAGGGKAEQIFLRGFDIDHGTDIAISVDGLPVNMSSHAHGQGYADLHFIIPETIDNVDFGKGPYYANQGNFNTAGYVNLKTKKRLDENYISVEGGQFNSLRGVGLLKLLDEEKSTAYVASELSLTDGFFDASQDFNRFNIMGRYNYNNFENQEFTLTASHFQSKWNASGQIPQRAVDQGLISRFGAIDDTEGGITSRSNLLVNHIKQISDHQNLVSKAYISKYDFELYSNFTFFLEDRADDGSDTINDQIRQKEGRTIIGAESVYKHNFHQSDHDSYLSMDTGIGFRYDDNNDVELSQSQNRRETLNLLNFGDVDEVNSYGFISAKFRKKKWTLNPGLRVDYFNFGYVNNLSSTFDSRSTEDIIVSPKFNVIYSPSNDWQLFVKSGFGFHSNDSRVVNASRAEIQVQNPDISVGSIETLPKAFGVDVGTIFKPTKGLVINTALWGLNLEQEFVYVGDAAVVEPSGKTQRYGVEFGLRYQVTPWLYLNADANYTHARSVDEPDGEDFIPLAPDFTSVGGIYIKNLKKFSGGLSYRYIDDRPANEDDSLSAEGYFVSDFNLNYSLTDNWTFGVIVENLFDVEWNETQFATETRLRGEAESVEEITFTPGTPFSIRAKIAVQF